MNIYRTYLAVFALVKSGTSIASLKVAGEEESSAIALGVNDAKNPHCMFPAPKWQVIARVTEMCLDENPNGTSRV